MPLPTPQAILFDLDGTLADTAPDLAAALNRLRATHGLADTPYEQLRPFASAGARGLIGVAFGLQPEDEGYENLRTTFLDNYASALVIDSILFDDIPALLQDLRQRQLKWGVVTNKAARFTNPLISKIGLQDADCVISGDTTAHAKPHPAPLLEAAHRLHLQPHECWYVGDDLRDIQAGNAAGMTTVAATWGYCGHAEPISWKADAIIHSPLELCDLLEKSRPQ